MSYLTRVTEDFEPAAGLEFSPDSYPHTGIFCLPSKKITVIIYATANVRSLLMLGEWKPDDYVKEMKPGAIELAPQIAQQPINLEKILAVVLHREAALEVVKK